MIEFRYNEFRVLKVQGESTGPVLKWLYAKYLRTLFWTGDTATTEMLL